MIYVSLFVDSILAKFFRVRVIRHLELPCWTSRFSPLRSAPFDQRGVRDMSDVMPRLNGIALVTGASSGIGAKTAEALVAIGCRVICAGRDLGRLKALTDRLGDRSIALELDVNKNADAILGGLPAEWQSIEVLINSAGHDVGGRRRFDEGSVAEWTSIIETNVVGLISVTRAVVPGMVQRDRGHIVNIGSIFGLKAYATGTIYSASKFAVHGFSEALRLDYRGTGIRVTEILPGMVRTNLATSRFGDSDRAKKYYDDFGICLNPEDVARTIVFAVQQPPHVVISQLVVVPNSQP